MKDKEKFEILLEDMNGKLDAFGEGQALLIEKVDNLEKKFDLHDEKVIKIDPVIATLKDHSRQIQEHERRLDFVEKQVA